MFWLIKLVFDRESCIIEIKIDNKPDNILSLFKSVLNLNSFSKQQKSSIKFYKKKSDYGPKNMNMEAFEPK